jgi:hypothetical protein
MAKPIFAGWSFGRSLGLALLFILPVAAQAAAPAPPPVESPPAPPAERPVPKPPTVVREFDSGKYKVRVDRAAQQLHIDSSKPIAWLDPTVAANQTVEVVRDGAPLQRGRERIAAMPKGRKLFVSKIEGKWAAATIVHRGKQESGWMQIADLKPLPGEPRAYKHLHNAGGQFLSAAMLIQKAKQFDDGLYAAAELAAEEGKGEMPAKSQLLRQWPAKVDPAEGGQGLAVLLAARELGGIRGEVPAAQKKAVADLLKAFNADPKRSKPLGFYTWSKALEGIFRQDRMLQTPLRGGEDVDAISLALQANPELRDKYVKHVRLAYRLTNPPVAGGSDLIPLIGDKPAPLSTDVGQWRILPPSVSHESQLFLRLFPSPQPVPDDFDLMKTLVAEIRAGKIDLTPTPESGWYDHQTWALQPLLLPETMPEASHLSVGDEYRKHLEELFKGTLALTRETHVKQLDFPPPAAAAPPIEEEKKPELFIAPDLVIEPLPQMYLRRAQSYLFVREVLAAAFGEAALTEMHRQTQDGPVKATLDEELGQMATIFYGAHVAASRQLGKEEEPVPAGIGANGENAAIELLAWHQTSASDPDLGRDARMMVPVFLDPENQRIKVWCMLGWQTQDAYVSYAKHPAVSATNEAGDAVDIAKAFDVHYWGQGLSLACPIFAEVWVTTLLNRDEFRRHCDTYVTPGAIVANLE